MGRIVIEATPLEFLDLDTDFRHLYLVFQDDQGVETVITAAPDKNGPFDFGNIEVSAGGLLEGSDVALGTGTPGSRGSREIDVGARDPADVWAVMLQQAHNIDKAGLDYAPLGDNSNTVVKSVLRAVDIDIRDNLPNAVDRHEAVGVGNDLDFKTTLTGTPGDDIIVGGDKADVLKGQDGDDRLLGGRGGDLMTAGAGSDLLRGEEGADQMIGGPGADRLRGNQDADQLYGGPDDDALFGNTGDDMLHGGRGDDMLHGGLGGDTLHGGAGADQLEGGPGSDRFDYVRLGDAGDTIVDFETGAGGDSLMLADLLQDFDPATSDVNDFVSLSAQPEATVVGVNVDGQGADVVPLATLAGVIGVTVDGMVTDGNLVVAQQTS